MPRFFYELAVATQDFARNLKIVSDLLSINSRVAWFLAFNPSTHDQAVSGENLSRARSPYFGRLFIVNITFIILKKYILDWKKKKLGRAQV